MGDDLEARAHGLDHRGVAADLRRLLHEERQERVDRRLALRGVDLDDAEIGPRHRLTRGVERHRAGVGRQAQRPGADGARPHG
jgi:hypothetical protein